MLLTELIRVLPEAVVRGNRDREIRSLAYDSRRVQPQGLFVAVPGQKQDGHDFIGPAIARGAEAVVLEKEPAPLPPEITCVRVPDAREALARLGACFYGYPAEKLGLIGLTGTNGKTTTAYLIEALLQAAGIPTGVLGTIEYRCGRQTWKAPVTTPESLDLQFYLANMVREGAARVVMEVSSHALDQGRCRGLAFEIAVFTNLTQDHLDYHQNMENYYQAKARLFWKYLKGTARRPRPLAVINRDDPYGKRLWSELTTPRVDFSLDPRAAYHPLDIHADFSGNQVRLQTPRGIFSVHSPLLGRHNVYNLLAAWAVGEALELSPKTLTQGVASLKKVPGRLERVENPRGLTILVDYAHTPEALRFVLQSLKELTDQRIITVFGCGGDRDTTKRAPMGRIAAAGSHLAIVTSDNPRSEDPQRIIAQIEAGMTDPPRPRHDPDRWDRLPEQPGYLVIPDRRQAIHWAVQRIAPEDVLLLAGKGHETYQLSGDQVLFFDDRLEAFQAAEAARV